MRVTIQEAIVKLISEGITDTTFDAIIDEMIANAWFSVREFHIHLSGIQNGEVRDGLERAVIKLTEVSTLSSNASKTEIKNAISIHASELKPYKEQLTKMVPYRALASFFQRINQYEKVKWLQMNNPEIPGLVYKLAPLDEKMRKLGKIRKLWEAVLDVQPIFDVFTGKQIAPNRYDVDHFIPWSFVMNDELWNLMPMIPFGPDRNYTTPAIQSKSLFISWRKNMQPVYDSARRQGYELWNYDIV